MKNCTKCGEPAEIREEGGEFVAGCWSSSHYENLSGICCITGEPYHIGYDLYPLTGLRKKTKEEAVDSWNQWNELFNEQESDLSL